MALGVSGKALLTMLIVSTLLCFLPVVFSHRKVPGSIVSGGSNSLVLSAACHASVLARPDPSNGGETHSGEHDVYNGEYTSRRRQSGYGPISKSMGGPLGPYNEWTAEGEIATGPVMGTGSMDDGEGRLLLPFESSEQQEEHELFLLREVTISKVKWGAMAADPYLLNSLNLDRIDGPVKHLGFGNEQDHVETPQEGHFYI